MGFRHMLKNDTVLVQTILNVLGVEISEPSKKVGITRAQPLRTFLFKAHMILVGILRYCHGDGNGTVMEWLMS